MRFEVGVVAQFTASHHLEGDFGPASLPHSHAYRVEVGVSGIAHNAVRYVKNGRRLGNRNSGRGAMDVYHRRAQATCGFRVVSLSSNTEIESRPARNVWREWVAEDNRVTPADEACFRLDFGAWLEGLPARKREMAELLAEGHETGVVARTVGVSMGRVSQMRSELAASWRAFQGEDGAGATHGLKVDRVSSLQ